MTRNTIIATVVLLILFALAGSSRNIILGSASTATLPSAPALAGTISQALGQTSTGSLPVDGTDFHLSTKYFDNNTWAVTYITPINGDFDPSTAVLKKTNGIYQIAISPTNALPNGELFGLPKDVANYLRGRVAVYQPQSGE
jgi:hypothetical protein